MRLTSLTTLTAVSSPVMSQHLFVTSYAGTITSLALNHDLDHANLSSVASNDGCTPGPSWLTLDPASNALFCLGENPNDLQGNGSVSSYTMDKRTGALTQQSKQKTINGPVCSTLYESSNGSKALALAQYGGSAVSAFTVSPGLQLALLQEIEIPFPDAPGPDAARQDAAHPHEAILDPTGKFVIVPDLGKDLVHVFRHDPSTGILTMLEPLKAKPGSGPRHAAFWSPCGTKDFNGDSPLFFYLVAELGATVTGYQVTYKANDEGLSFAELFAMGTLGGATPHTIVAPAEVAVSPDNQFLVISNRNDSSFVLPNYNPTNATGDVSDSLATYRLQANGSLLFTQLAAAGGRFPRQFQMNAAGDKLATVLQNDDRVAVLKRDVETGLIGPVLATLSVPNQPTCIVWGPEKQ